MKTIFCKSLWIQLWLLSVLGMFIYNASLYAENEADWMPDPNLRQAVREALEIPGELPMLPADIASLTHLVAEHDIESLKGLEHAINLEFLHIGRTEVSDLTPLVGLENLRVLKLFENRISDISPLSGLIDLEFLQLQNNQVSDLTPLANLHNLRVLGLRDNQISDISPLSGLVGLQELNLAHNFISDFTPLVSLTNLQTLHIYHNPIPCEVDRPSIVERVVNRSYPSVFTTWTWGIENDPQSPNESLWSYQKRSVSRRDLFWQGSFRAKVRFQYLTPEGSKLVFDRRSNPDNVMDERNQMQSLNPDFLFLAELYYYGTHPSDYYPEDWKYWLRDEEGNGIKEQGYGAMLIDYTLPGAEDHFVQMAVSVAKCGIFDGIFMDLWAEEEEEIPGTPNTAHLYHGNRVEALVSLVKRIREAVGDDFLIIVNTRTLKIPRSAPYVNGAFIETFGKAYPRERLIEFENALSWYEDNFRYPQINCLNIAKSPSEPWDSPANQQLVRATTTLSLTHSNGYINFKGKNNGEQYWSPFWDAPLGRPIGGDETKGQLYRGRDGVFIREFTNGWAVYNRSGEAQTISLPTETTGVASGLRDTQHTIPDLDGEIYLKSTGNVADLNSDDIVNILDLVIVANAFGETAPDLNGDGVVNIQDLVIVANAFE